MSLQYRRLIRACVIVGVLMLVIIFIGWTGRERSQEVVGETIDGAALNEEYALSVLQTFEQRVETSSTDLPASFEEEVLSLVERADVHANEQTGIVSFTVEESPDKALKTIEKEMVERGWMVVDSGSDVCETCLKGTGIYRWGFVSCTEMGGLTCVVVQVVPTEKTEM